jgi:L-fucose mutarotase
MLIVGGRCLQTPLEIGIMLIGIPAILGPDLLYTLRAMGHGDEIALVDGNYPAQDHARRLVRADGHGVLVLLSAILQVMPLDRAVPDAIFRASLNNDPKQTGTIHREVEAVCAKLAPGFRVKPLSGEALYPRIRSAHTIVATSELALFGNVILRKGVVTPDGTA